MDIVSAWLRIELRLRWRSLVVLGLLIALSSAVVLSAVAGARRGDSAVQRVWSAGTLPATAAVLPNQPGFDWAAVARFPGVAAVGRFCGVLFLEDYPGSTADFQPCDGNLMYTLERPVMLAGRVPVGLHEAAASRRFLDRSGLRLGDTVKTRLPSREQIDAVQRGGPEPTSGEGPRLSLRIVGVGVSPWLYDRPNEPGGIGTSGAIAATYPELTFADRANALVRLSGGEGGLPAFQARLTKLAGHPVDVWNLPEMARHQQHIAAFEARCLLAFAGAVLLAALLLVGQAVARYTAASIGDLQALRASGLTPLQSVQAAVAGPLLAALAGAAAGVVIATAASRWFPIGSSEALEPAPGIQFDALVLAGGGAAVPVLVTAGALVAAWAALRTERSGQAGGRSAIAAAVRRAGAPVPVTVGVRFALEPGRGRTAVPTRPALIGAVVGVLGVIGALTFASAVADAAQNPVRFGQTHQLETLIGEQGQEYVESAGVLAAVAAVPGVAGVNDTRFAVAETPRHGKPLYLHSYDPVGGPMPVVLTAGRMPSSAGEVVLAPNSATALGARVGSRVPLTGSRPTPPLLVTGIGFVPVTWHNGYSTGGWLSRAGYQAMFGALAFKGHVGLVALAPGADPGEVSARIGRVLGGLGGPAKSVRFTPPAPLPQLAEIRQVQDLPEALGAFLVLLAVGAVGHTLVIAVRRRQHDIAVLRAVGMTRWQSRAVVLTQASVLALAGLVFGIPLGVALGRTVWLVVADYTPLQYVPPLASWALVLVSPLALLVANALATWPGHRAARLRIGHVLRAE